MILLNSAELAAWKRTAKSQALSTKRVELRKAKHYPPIAALLDLSVLDKALTAFGENYPEHVNPVTGRIHAELWNRHHCVGACVLLKAKFAADAETRGVPQPVRRSPRLCPDRRRLRPDGDARQRPHFRRSGA